MTHRHDLPICLNEKSETNHRTLRRLAVVSLLAAVCGFAGCDDSSSSGDDKILCDESQKSNDSCTCGDDGQWSCRCSGSAPNDSCSCDAEGRWACRCSGRAPNDSCSCGADGRWSCQCSGAAPKEGCTCGSDGSWDCTQTNTCSGTAPKEGCTCGNDGNWDCSSACTGLAPKEGCTCGSDGEWDCSNAIGGDHCGNCLFGQNCDPSDNSCVYTSTPNLTISVSPETIPENGGEATVTVALTVEPNKDVTLNLALSGTGASKARIQSGGEVISSIVLPRERWSEGAEFDIVAIPDDEFGDETTVTLQVISYSENSLFSNKTATATVAIEDSNVAQILVEEPESLTTTEDGGIAEFGIRLTSKPSADVKIGISLTENYAKIEGAQTNGTLELTFTPSNWSETQTVTVKGLDDETVLNAQAHTYRLQFSEATSTDPHYAGVSHEAIPLTNLDNDSPNIIVNEKLTLREGEESSFGVTLSPAPVAETTITATASPSTDCSIAGDAFQKIAANATGPIEFRVQTTDDDIISSTARQCTITLTAASSDTQAATSYNGMSKTVTATIVDNDRVGLTASTSHTGSLYAKNSPYCDGGIVSGCKSSVNVCYKLGSKPEAAVTLDISLPSGANSWIQTDKTSLTIAPADYQKDTNCVTVTDIFDYGTENTSDKKFAVTATPRSSDANYNDAKLAVSKTIVLADRAHGGIQLEEVSADKRILHEGQGDSVTARFWAFFNPKGNSSFTVKSSDSRMSVSPKTISVTASDWWKPKTVTLTSENDDVVNQTTKAHYTVEWMYNGKAYSQQSAEYNVLDDEERKIILTCDGTDLYPETTSTSTADKAFNGVDDKEVITCSVDISSPSESELTITLGATNGQWATLSTNTVKFSAGDKTTKTFTVKSSAKSPKIGSDGNAGYRTKISASHSSYTGASITLNVYTKYHFYTYKTSGEFTGSLPVGQYRLHAWGASGAPFGDSASPASTTCGNRSGYGAYASGVLNSTAKRNFKWTIGGAGTYETCNDCGGKYTSGGYNGGGHGRAGGNGRRAYGGGGATDFCLGAQCDSMRLEHRSLVAGGGGGAGSSDCSDSSRGGNAGAAGEHAGGGLYSSHGETWTDSSGVAHYYAEGGYINGPKGTFGQGMSVAGNGDCTGSYRRGGGGGGWYGGLASCKETNGGKSLSDVGGGGGSSYIYTGTKDGEGNQDSYMKLSGGISYKGGSSKTPDFYIQNERLVWYTNRRVGSGQAVIEVWGIIE